VNHFKRSDVPTTVPDGVVFEEATCPTGCSPDDVHVHENVDRLHGVGGIFRVVRCRNCGLMRTNPRPTEASMGVYYPPSYGPHEVTESQRLDVIKATRRSRKGLVSRVRRRLGSGDVLPDLKPGHALELGCGTGAMLDRLARLGWTTEGIENAPMAAARARTHGHVIHTETLETARLKRKDYDLVLGLMVLEHVHQPLSVLKRLYGLTRPEGWLVLSVPDVSGLDRRIFGPHWYGWQLPTHLHHFTPASLRRLLAAGGWRVERLWHQRTVGNYKKSTELAMLNWMTPESARFLTRHPRGRTANVLGLIAGLSGQSGRMAVWARKARPG